MSKRKWLRGVLTVAVLLLAASAGFSRALRTSAARRYLLARLTASFGRPVDVARFDFSLLDGARLEAYSVTVGEDPHFGNEYFLRADALTVGLRWSALLFGRVEFGSFSLLRPSLNLSRDAEGHWNIERWLPPNPAGASRPGFAASRAAPRGRAARLYRIDVDTGRINFKQQDVKSPFALIDVSGSVEQDSSGRWDLDLEARPMRAGVELQDIGMLRLRGTIAGTSARLQPAELNLTWRAASLADTLRLARQNDYGIRGGLALDLNARVAPPKSGPAVATDSAGANWSISAVARLTDVHGWKLPGRTTDPDTNVSLEASWRLGQPRAEIRNLLIEMKSSHLQGVGEVDWAHGVHPQLHIETSTLGLADVLSWYRAMHPGVAENLRIEGALGLDVTLGGWPLRMQQGAIASVGARLTAGSLPTALQIGPINASVSSGGLDFAATKFSFSASAQAKNTAAAAGLGAIPSAFLIRGSIFPEVGGVYRWPPDWNLSINGATPRLQDWLALSRAFAQPLNAGWTAAGGLTVKMSGTRRTESPAAVWLGTMDFQGLTVSPDYVNRPVRLPVAHLVYTPVQQTITMSAAQGLGAAWHGTILRKLPVKQWTFDLTADHLDATELDRWLGPRARPSFLERLRNFGSAAAVVPPPVIRMEARGRLRVGEIDMAPMRLEQFDGDVELNGRILQVHKAQADFFGGKVSGTLDADLLPNPSYEFQGRFNRVNLSQLARAVPFLNNRIAGTASATLTLAAHGIGRGSLIESMEGKGTLAARNAEIPGLDLTALFPGDTRYPSLDPFTSVEGTFRIRGGGIDLADFVLDHSRGRLQAEGRIDFSHALNLRIHPSILQATTSPVSASLPGFLLRGTIEAPKLTVPATLAKPAARPGTRGR